MEEKVIIDRYKRMIKINHSIEWRIFDRKKNVFKCFDLLTLLFISDDGCLFKQCMCLSWTVVETMLFEMYEHKING